MNYRSDSSHGPQIAFHHMKVSVPALVYWFFEGFISICDILPQVFWFVLTTLWGHIYTASLTWHHVLAWSCLCRGFIDTQMILEKSVRRGKVGLETGQRRSAIKHQWLRSTWVCSPLSESRCYSVHLDMNISKVVCVCVFWNCRLVPCTLLNCY